ncbi:MAG: type IV pilus assembly protein PilM, partial [Candidatus Neomarinimicrobiota bacterium]
AEEPPPAETEEEPEELAEKAETEDQFEDFGEDLEEGGPVTFVYQKEKKFSFKRLLSSFRGTKARVGLDIGSYAIKYILASDVHGEITLEDFGYIKIPADIRGNQDATNTFIKETIQKIFADTNLKKAKVNLLVSGADIGIKNIQMPKVGKKELQEAVKWSTKKHLSFSADESVLDFKVLKEVTVDGVPKLDILVVAALETLVEDQIGRLSGLTIPAKILPTPLAMWRYYVGHYPTENLQNVMLIDIGHETTMINVIHDENLRFAREIGISGKDLTEALIGSMTTSRGERIMVDEEKAELFKLKYGYPKKEHEKRVSDEDIPLSQLSSRLRSPLERLANEIQRSIQYYAKEFSFGPIDKIYLCGGTAGLMNLDTFLADYLNMEVVVSDPLKIWTIGKAIANVDLLQQNAMALAPAAGISIDTTPELNLLPQKYIQESQVRSLRTFFRLFLVASLVTVVSLSTTTSIKKKDFDARLKSLQEQVSQMTPVQKDVIQLQKTRQDIQKKVSVLKKMFNEPTYNVKVLKIISNVMPEDVTLESIQNLNPVTSSKNIQLQLVGYLETTKYNANVKLADLVMQLEKSGYLTNVTLANTSPVESNGFTGMKFTLTCSVSGYEN